MAAAVDYSDLIGEDSGSENEASPGGEAVDYSDIVGVSESYEFALLEAAEGALRWAYGGKANRSESLIGEMRANSLSVRELTDSVYKTLEVLDDLDHLAKPAIIPSGDNRPVIARVLYDTFAESFGTFPAGADLEDHLRTFGDALSRRDTDDLLDRVRRESEKQGVSGKPLTASLAGTTVLVLARFAWELCRPRIELFVDLHLFLAAMSVAMMDLMNDDVAVSALVRSWDVLREQLQKIREAPSRGRSTTPRRARPGLRATSPINSGPPRRARSRSPKRRV